MALIDALTLPEKLRAAAFVLVSVAHDFRAYGRTDLADTTVEYATALSDLAADISHLATKEHP